MMGTPNGLAYLALILWWPLCAVFFAFLRPASAAALSVVGAALLLPANLGIDVPVITELDKELMPPLFALLGCAIFHPRLLQRARPGTGPELLMGFMAVGAMFTSLSNPDPLHYGPVVLPGEGLYDGLVNGIDLVLRYAVPFLLGRAVVRRVEDLEQVFLVMALGALGYSLLAVVELRMAPHMNLWVYGYHQSDFSQTVRGGGFRPKIFMRHGLNVTLYFSFCVIVLAAFGRARQRLLGAPTSPLFAYLAVILVLCKSLAATLYAFAGSLLLLVRSPAVMRLVAVGAAALVFSYPLLRALELVPVDTIVEWAEQGASVERSQSIATRFENEGLMLAKARDRLLFGWGGYGRPRIYDPLTGQDVSVTDGFWVLEIGQRGLWGYACIFGLLLWPVVRAGMALPRIRSRRSRTLVWALTLLCTLYVVDLVPNSSVSAYLTFLSGSLAGLAPRVVEQERQALRRRRVRPPPADPTPGGDAAARSGRRRRRRARA
jgi:hypothetical protein